MLNARKNAIINKVCTVVFKINDNPSASGEEPIYEVSAFSSVRSNEATIDRVSRETGVDARLLKAIMYMEMTHGYYDIALAIFDKNKSILPMNINTEYWGDVFGSRKDLKNIYCNIKAGALIVQGIQANLPYGSPISHIATLYNNLNAVVVSDYGARVAEIYKNEPWRSSDQSVTSLLTGVGSTAPR